LKALHAAGGVTFSCLCMWLGWPKMPDIKYQEKW